MSKTKKVVLRQARLRRSLPDIRDEVGGIVANMVCLLADDGDLAVGKWVTLDDGPDEERWEIIELSDTVPQYFVHRTWENNI